MVLATFPVIEGVPGSVEFFNLVFFAVVFSTILQGTTFEWVAEKLGVTTNEAALPAPLIEPGAVKRLGAEVVDYLVGPDHAIAGRRVRELGLPREALLSVIIRGDQAVPPRGSTRIEAGDRLNVLVRQEVAVEFRDLLRTLARGPGRPGRARVGAAAQRGAQPAALRRGRRRRRHGPRRSTASRSLEQFRTRRDVAGALVLLEDGRYAFTGPVVGVGPRPLLQDAARRRLAAASGRRRALVVA